jgi:hypothetical protein
MIEHGPYIYREHDDYIGPTEWDVDVPIPGQPGKTTKGINMIFNQYALFDDTKIDQMDSGLDDKIWQINQAGLGLWWTGDNTEEWRTLVNVFIFPIIQFPVILFWSNRWLRQASPQQLRMELHEHADLHITKVSAAAHVH